MKQQLKYVIDNSTTIGVLAGDDKSTFWYELEDAPSDYFSDAETKSFIYRIIPKQPQSIAVCKQPKRLATKRQLYVTSKNFGDATYLIGLLTEDNGVFKFEYKLGGILQAWYLLIQDFPDVSKTYEGAKVEHFINRFVPPQDHKFYKQLMVSANLTEHNVWEMLKVFGLRNMQQDAYLHEELPKNIIIYEPLD